VLLVGNLAWSGLPDAAVVAPGVLWVAFVFAAILMMGRSVHGEHDRGTWDALAVLPVEWGTIFLAKTLANLVVLFIVEAAALAVYGLLFEQGIGSSVFALLPVLVLGSVGLVAAGTLFAGVAAHGRNREILLPILLIPALFPVLMMAVQATQKVLLGLPWQQTLRELELLVAFDAIFIAVGWLTFEHVVGD
jgi:heme exporter protein B